MGVDPSGASNVCVLLGVDHVLMYTPGRCDFTTGDSPFVLSLSQGLQIKKASFLLEIQNLLFKKQALPQLMFGLMNEVRSHARAKILTIILFHMLLLFPCDQ